MKLTALHTATTRDLREGLDPAIHQKLAYVQMMVAMQGKDPMPVVQRLRGMVDPSFSQQEGGKANFKRWLESARAGDERTGKAHGKKVKISVLESVVREFITEGFFSDVGSAILSKLKSIIDDEPQEHEMVSKAVDEYPALAWIHRYARKSEKPIWDDEAFWQKLNETTNGMGDKVKELVMATFKRAQAMAEAIGSSRVNILAETVIEEAKISQVLQSLGLDEQASQSLMGDYGIRDDDYDLARMRQALDAAKGHVQTAMAGLRKMPQQAMGAVKDAASSAASSVGGAAQGMMGAVKGAASSVGGAAQGMMGGKGAVQPAAQPSARPKSSSEIRQIQQQNMDFADSVVLTTAFLLKSAKAAKEGSQQPVEQAAQELGGESNVVSSSELESEPSADSMNSPAGV